MKQNHIHDGPHTAIHLHGNDHIISHNEIHHVCRETSDAGAIYLAHNPTYRGTVIEHNWIHDLGGFDHQDIVGIYLDDFASGTVVRSNLLERSGRAIAVGGGRDNRIEENVILDCLAAVQIDSRGTTWRAASFGDQSSHYHRMIATAIEKYPHLLDRYPSLRDVLNEEPALPKGNLVSKNIYNSRVGVDLQDGLTNQVIGVSNNLGNANELVRATSAGYELTSLGQQKLIPIPTFPHWQVRSDELSSEPGSASTTAQDQFVKSKAVIE